MSNPISWDVAERVGIWVGAGRLKAIGGSEAVQLDGPTWSKVSADFEVFTEQAEGLVVAETGLAPLSGHAHGAAVDRADWVRANIRSFRRLLAPLLEKLEESQLPKAFSTVSGTVTGTQLGLVIGWMSTRVLGQYDILFAEDSDGGTGGGDEVSYVAPNIVGLERRHGFPTDQFRLWIALHEVTHRCQFTGVPWLHEYFLSLVEEGLSGMTPDPKRFTESIKRAVDEIRAGRNPLEQSGLIGLVADPEQLATIGRIQALMSLLEGHGDMTMNRAGSEHVPEAARFAGVLRDRRRKAGPATRLMQQLIGMDAKLRQYEQGERFIEAVEAAGGRELMAKVWERPEHLPSLDEIREPALWVARMSTPQLVAG